MILLFELFHYIHSLDNEKLADTLRKQLEDSGVTIEDKEDKTTWKYK